MIRDGASVWFQRLANLPDQPSTLTSDSVNNNSGAEPTLPPSDEAPMAPSSSQSTPREKTQTNWSIPSALRLDPSKSVNILCWVVNKANGETIARSIAICIRKAGGLVLFDHKCTLEEHLRIDYQDRLLRKSSNGGWKEISWHVPIDVCHGNLILLKTAAAVDDLHNE
jgi:hypothetical protein